MVRAGDVLPNPTWARWITAFFVALLVHGGLTLAIRLYPLDPPAETFVVVEDAADLVLDNGPTVMADQQRPSPLAERIEPHVAGRTPIMRGTRVPGTERGDGESHEQADVGPNATANANANETPNEGVTLFRREPVDLHLGSRTSVLFTEPPSEGNAPRDTSGLKEGLDAADVARGLGRGGPVRSAVEYAAHSADAPSFGTAVFAVEIGADSNIRVRLSNASSDYSGWASLCPAIEMALRDQPLRLPPGSGLRVTVGVEASEQFPGGARPPTKEGATASASAGKVRETKDHIEFELPYVSLGYRGRRCGGGVVLGPGGISGGGGCEVGVAMRVVATRILREERL